jgi:hypothetical protein
VAGLFGQALSAFSSILSKLFWFGAFLPVALFTAINLLLTLTLPGSDWASALWNNLTAEKWPWLLPAVVALIVVAYALAPLVPLFRAILDGRRLPDWLYDQLRRHHLQEQRRAYEKLLEAENYLTVSAQLIDQAPARLLLARDFGPRANLPANPAALSRAEVAVSQLERYVARGQRPAIWRLDAVEQALLFATTSTPVAANATLESLVLRFTDTLGLINDYARDPRDRCVERYSRLPRVVQSTAIGNARRLSENYGLDMYRADFAFLWSRVQMVIPDTDPVARRIEAARSVIDFAVLSLVLSVVSLAIWLPLQAFLGNTPWVFLLLGTVGPLVIHLFYQLVVESQISLGEVVQGAVDKFRPDVLKMLHIKPPATLSAEREIWTTLSSIARGEARSARGEARDQDMMWDHPP